MEFETELLIVSARHFKGKSDGKDYYMLFYSYGWRTWGVLRTAFGYPKNGVSRFY